LKVVALPEMVEKISVRKSLVSIRWRMWLLFELI
jgi:hypothetical protein